MCLVTFVKLLLPGGEDSGTIRGCGTQMSEGITELLVNWSHGDQAALNQLMPLVYDELRRLASSYLRRERNQDSLQPTLLVHEAYLRLIDQHQVNWQNRAQFFGLAATLMRHILVDHARQHRAAKRGGGTTGSHSPRPTGSARSLMSI
jgi:RNA polymerase sigma factor (TIGR02999 family)